ncbi:hypothetical protein [Mycolicibacterium komossense]|uniref:hypothetical protein n=1 Tax=Mycolicibacterium komossense TaxID=1779 RepID=UPI0021F275CB|nr:hypothetical protein [Mycolicibacterium komossense]
MSATSGIPLQRAVLATVTGALTVAVLLAGTPARAEPSTTVPSPDQLTDQISVIFDINADKAYRASFLEAGDAALPVADAVGGPMAQHRSMVSMRIENPTLNGDQLDTQLVMSVMGIGAQRREMDWIEKGGTWKLSTRSLCSIYLETSRTSSCPL